MRTEFGVGNFEVVEEGVITTETWLKGKKLRIIKNPPENVAAFPFATHSLRWLKTKGVRRGEETWIYIRVGSYEDMKESFDRMTKVK